jgi:hypothetical protein
MAGDHLGLRKIIHHIIMISRWCDLGSIVVMSAPGEDNARY